MSTRPIEPGDVVRYSKQQDVTEGEARFLVLEVHRDVETPRAHIQFICEWPIKPVEVVAVEEIELA